MNNPGLNIIFQEFEYNETFTNSLGGYDGTCDGDGVGPSVGIRASYHMKGKTKYLLRLVQKIVVMNELKQLTRCS